jgi:NH3-dependent NAD+ synthetase
MSGGVDSSVTAKLLADHVRKQKDNLKPSLIEPLRITIFQPSSCVTGIHETSPALTVVANGRKTGKMSSESAKS